MGFSLMSNAVATRSEIVTSKPKDRELMVATTLIGLSSGQVSVLVMLWVVMTFWHLTVT